MIGRVVKGKYKIYDEVGTGGFATVYLGRNLETNEIVAIKILSAQYVEEEEYLERFRREAGLAERLQHPNIVRILDHGIEDGVHFLVMEFVEGLTLDKLLERKGRLSVEETLSYAEQTCAGLQAAFQVGVVHRDIKPANLMITPDGTVKIMDFGIARMESLEGLTKSGMFLGTPRYIAPEMARGARVDVRSDLYGMGLIIYQMLTGIPPFDADNPWAVLRLQLEADPPPIHQTRPDVPQWLESIVFKALAKDPAHRFQTPADMLAALEGHTPTPGPIVFADPSAARADAKAAPVPLPRRGASRGLVWGLVAAALVVALALAALLVFGLGGGKATPAPTATLVVLVDVDTVTAQPSSTARIIIITTTAEDTDTPQPVPSETASPLPTDTPVPEPTDTLVPTETPLPTETPAPEPTDTSQPTIAPTPGPTNTPRPTDTPTAAPTPTVPAVSGRIAFSAGGQLHVVHAATGQDIIAPIPHMRQPDLRADGQLIVVNGEGGGRDSLWTIDAKSGAFVREQSPFTNDFRPFWSPDGSRIVYDSLHMGQGNHNLYVNDLDSKRDDFLFFGSMAIIGTSPVWMHDDWVAFTGCDYWVPADRGGGSKCGIYRMPSWSDRPVLIKPGDLTMRATDNYGPSLVFMSQESGNWEVYVMPSRGGDARNLSNSPNSQDGLGTISPNGKLVAFASNRGGSWAVWLVGLDGSGLTKLFDLPAPPTGTWTEEHISWGP